MAARQQFFFKEDSQESCGHRRYCNTIQMKVEKFGMQVLQRYSKTIYRMLGTPKEAWFEKSV